MPCKEASIRNHIYHSYLKTKKKIFADEKDKWKFLDIVLRLQEQKQFQVYAFVVLDNEIQILWETEDAGENIEDILLEQYRTCYCRMYQVDAGMIQAEIERKRIEYMDRLVWECREIHRLPQKYGYVQQMKDYWWSSYVTYCGIYQWQMVNTEKVLQYYAEDLELGRRKFLQYHRKTPSNKKTKDTQINDDKS